MNLMQIDRHTTATTGSAPGVVLRGTVKSYRTAGAVVRAVRGIDVSIAPGDTIALLGPNGAGKSTTIDMLLGLITPDSGSVSLMGGPPQASVARGMVGAMLQAGALIRDVTPRELLTMMASLHPDPLEVADALELTAIYETYNERGVFLGYVVRDASGALVAVRDSLAEAEDVTRSPGLRGGILPEPPRYVRPLGGPLRDTSDGGDPYAP